MKNWNDQSKCFSQLRAGVSLFRFLKQLFENDPQSVIHNRSSLLHSGETLKRKLKFKNSGRLCIGLQEMKDLYQLYENKIESFVEVFLEKYGQMYAKAIFLL